MTAVEQRRRVVETGLRQPPPSQHPSPNRDPTYASSSTTRGGVSPKSRPLLYTLFTKPLGINTGTPIVYPNRILRPSSDSKEPFCVVSVPAPVTGRPLELFKYRVKHIRFFFTRSKYSTTDETKHKSILGGHQLILYRLLFLQSRRPYSGRYPISFIFLNKVVFLSLTSSDSSSSASRSIRFVPTVLFQSHIYRFRFPILHISQLHNRILQKYILINFFFNNIGIVLQII